MTRIFRFEILSELSFTDIAPPTSMALNSTKSDGSSLVLVFPKPGMTDRPSGQWHLAENQFPDGVYPDFFSRFPTEDFCVSFVESV